MTAETVDAEAQTLRHSEGEARGIPHAGAHAQPWTREGRPLLRHPRAAGIPPPSGAGHQIVAAETQTLRHSEGYASTPWNPPCGGTRPAVDAGGSPSPPSSSRSGDPPFRGSAVRCRSPSATNRGIPARSARMTAEFEKASSLPRWNQPGDSSPAAQALNDVRELKCAAGCDAPWTRKAPSYHPRQT